MLNKGIIFGGLTGDLSFKRSAGSHRIATFLRQEGMDIEVLDFLFSWTIDELKEFTRRAVTKDTVFFGFSVFASQWLPTYNTFVIWLKDTYPNVTIVFGGQTVAANILIPSAPVDFWIDTYGEYLILATLKYVNSGVLDKNKYSIATFNDRKVVRANNAFTSSQLPDYSMIYEKRDYMQPFEWSSLEISRGCKFSCAFCSYPLLSIKQDTTRVDHGMSHEMQYNYDNFGISKYYIMDSTFNDRAEKLVKVADVVEALDFDVWLASEVRIDLVHKDPSTIEQFKRMNLWNQFYGIESFNNPTRKIIHKAHKAETIQNISSRIDREMRSAMPFAGVMSFIVGLPLEEEKHVYETVEWLNTNWKDNAVLWNTLYIENKDHFGSTTSEFSNDPSKYGIELTKSSQDPSGMEWKHSTATFATATELSAATSKLLTSQGLLSHEFQYIEANNQRSMHPEELVTYTRDMYNSIQDGTGITEFINGYKHKKLSQH